MTEKKYVGIDRVINSVDDLKNVLKKENETYFFSSHTTLFLDFSDGYRRPLDQVTDDDINAMNIVRVDVEKEVQEVPICKQHPICLRLFLKKKYWSIPLLSEHGLCSELWTN